MKKIFETEGNLTPLISFKDLCLCGMDNCPMEHVLMSLEVTVELSPKEAGELLVKLCHEKELADLDDTKKYRLVLEEIE